MQLRFGNTSVLIKLIFFFAKKKHEILSILHASNK